MLTKHNSLDTSTLLSSQRMINAMYAEVTNHWAIGDSMDTCANETDWPMGYIQFVYATEQAAYQRGFNS